MLPLYIAKDTASLPYTNILNINKKTTFIKFKLYFAVMLFFVDIQELFQRSFSFGSELLLYVVW